MYIFAIELYPLISPLLNKLPASQFNGDEGSACANNEIIALQTVDNVHAGLQLVFNISKHTSPLFLFNK